MAESGRSELRPERLLTTLSGRSLNTHSTDSGRIMPSTRRTAIRAPMNWEAIGAIGEVAGAFGVIATLVYLAFQIRQNTKQLTLNEQASRVAVANASATAFRVERRSAYESAEVADLWLRGMNDPDDLSENDYYRFRLFMQNAIDGMWDIYSQTAATGHAQEIWKTQGISVVLRLVASVCGRRVWTQFRETYPEEFRTEIDCILAEI